MYMERRARPSANRLITERMEKEAYRKHKKRLGKVKARVDNTAPRDVPHLRRNRKKEVAMEERYSEIERENHILLQKMSDILNGPTPGFASKPRRYVTTLNRATRRQELARITSENQAILERILKSQPTYSRHKWDLESKENERLARAIQFHKPRHDAHGEGPHRSKSSARFGIEERGAEYDGDRVERGGHRRVRPQSAPVHRQEPGASKSFAGSGGYESGGRDAYDVLHEGAADSGAPDMVGDFMRRPGPAPGRRPRPQSAHPRTSSAGAGASVGAASSGAPRSGGHRYTAWHSEEEKAEFDRKFEVEYQHAIAEADVEDEEDEYEPSGGPGTAHRHDDLVDFDRASERDADLDLRRETSSFSGAGGSSDEMGPR